MLRFAADGIVGFSAVPLRLISKLGYFISLLSVVGLLYTVGVKLFRPEIAVPGWAFLASATFFLGGVQFVMLGVLGSYIGRIYTEVKGRPLYSIASIRPAAGAPSRLDERVERVQRVEPRADGAEVVPSETRA
jgi:dolichol-phosphate mannosyltransferase